MNPGWRTSMPRRCVARSSPAPIDVRLGTQIRSIRKAWKGFRVHAVPPSMDLACMRILAIPAGDLARLERLARYCARGPLAMERLERLADGRLLYRFKRPWRDGTTHIVLDPLEMLQKLAALIPAPHAHLVRYAGLFAPAAKWRSAIVPAAAAAVPSSVQGESVTVNLETIAHREDSLANVIDATMPVAEPSSVAPHPRN